MSTVSGVLTGSAKEVPKLLAQGGSYLYRSGRSASISGKLHINEIIDLIIDDLDEVRNKVIQHQHGFDGSQGTNSITGNAVTGTASGTATSGVGLTVTKYIAKYSGN